ncbi:kinase-like protein [Coniophora puteana RWD-64-598 SS2]|uniref:Kinase-like protein n=1 Tax=Coniophora puteana (strain RWD-64-598) TaxID=741705 RepID=A0A5M3MTM7_CONPW|nr:kinase-like protein [Coniophora puteana RWD-64-598 SS2]EIW82104.1 kinase-like protein [Coniophora puteana RWD-64-598 SS2]
MTYTSDTLPSFSGQTIDNGRYLLLDAIGSGAYGVVYRALDTKSDTLNPSYYAVKCLSKTELSTDQMLSQRREIHLLQMISGSPHTIVLHTVVEEEIYLYLIMEFSSGGDLYLAIKAKVYFHNDDLLKTAILQLLDGVDSCHNKGVYHRDLKPENVVCNEEGSDLRIIDFGLATKNRLCHDRGCGSSQYMSPECIGRGSTAHLYSALHNDIWSVGVVMLNMVTGRNPWRKAHFSDPVYSDFLADQEGALRDMLPISREFNDLLCKIFSIDPARRPTIPSLRQSIADIGTFYMSSYELADASGASRLAAGNIFPQVDLDTSTRESTLAKSYSGFHTQAAMDAFLAGWDGFDSDDSEILDLAEWGSVPPLHLSNGNSGPYSSDPFVLPDPEGGVSTGSSELSVSGSFGPITPETYADTAVGSIEDIPEMFSLAEPSITFDFAPPTSKAPPSERAVRKNVPRT